MSQHSAKQNVFRNKSKAELRLMLLWVSVKSLVQCLAQYALFLWQHNPLAIVIQRQRRLDFVENYGEVLIKPRLRDKVVDLFLTDYRRRKRLLDWVHSRLHRVTVIDFCCSWQDGIALCALLESVCPGVCPSYHLLQQHNRVKNCRLGLKLANKYLYLPMDLLSPEEMAIAEKSTEPKIIQYISMLKWASQNIKDKWASLHESLIAAKTGKCFAKGAGLRNGIVGRRSKFTIIISDTIGVFNLLVEVRGPNNEYCGERIVSLHQAKGMLDKGMIFDAMEPNRQSSDTIKYMEDGSGSTFVRKKVPPRYHADTTETIQLDLQCGEEGSFYVTFVPKRAGMHNISIKWQNHHVEGSPFRIKVYKASNISTKTLRGAQEKRVIYDSLSFSVDGSQEDSIAGSDRLSDDSAHSSIDGLSTGRTAAAIAKSKAYTKGRQLTVTRRRILRRIITRNGEDIVIEEAVSPTLSRQSSATDNSDDDSRFQKHSPIKDHVKEVVPANMTLTAKHMDPLNVPTHATKRLGTVEEEDKEKISSVESSSSGGQSLDTDAVKDALIKFSAQSSSDGSTPKRRKYSIDVIEDGTVESNQELTKVNVGIKTFTTANELSKLIEETPEIFKGNDPVMGLGNAKEPAFVNELDTITEIDTSNSTPDENGLIKDLGTWREGDIGDGADRVTVLSGKGTDVANHLEKVDEPHNQNLENIPEKIPTCRTRSDGPLYELRREVVSAVVSMAAKAPSFDESSNDMSSGDITSPDEDEDKGSSPQLKLLHSSSLKKACMYVSQTATRREEGDLLPLKNVKEIKKTKLTATRSLPIMRKLHQRDQVDSCSINDLLKCLKQLERETGVDAFETDRQRKVEHRLPIQTGVTGNQISDDCTKSQNQANRPLQNNSVEIDASVKPQNVFDFNIPAANKNSSSSFTGNKSRDEKNERLFKDSTSDDFLPTKSSKQTSQNENELTVIRSKHDNISCPEFFQKEAIGYSRTPPRELLKRQNPINSKNSSQESSNESDKKSKGRTSESTEPKDGSSEVIQGDDNVFRSISIQRSPYKDTLYTSAVHIIIPKPKVDKSTQVSHTEITIETGWNVMEGVYLLLRRMSIKVPTMQNETGVTCDSSFQTGSQAIVPVDNENDNCGAVHKVCIEDKANRDNNQGGEKRLPTLNIETVRRNNNLEVARNMNNVDDWLERNRQIMNLQANLEPARQMTEETVDSGYDDNPLNFNRNPRWSLPLIRQSNVNGHPRLFRRHYQGQMVLPAKLVLSVSSQSQGTSFEKREKGDDADDEYDNSVDEYTFDSEKLNLIRKRRHFSRRAESFSLSDSELETKKSSYKRNRRGWKDVLIVNRLFPKKEKIKPLNVWTSDKQGDLVKRKLNAIKKLPSITGAHQLSVESTDDDVTVFTDSTEPFNLNQKHQRMNLRKPHPPSSWKDVSSGSEKQLNSVSSLDESYRGFGVAKPDRNDFLSHIDEFQNICSTGVDIDSLERSAKDDDDNKFEIKSISRMSFSSRSTESEEIEENEILRSYIREKRHSWDGILDGFNAEDYHIAIGNESPTEKDDQSDENEQDETNRLDAVSEVENIFGDDESYIGKFIEDASNVDMYEGFDQNIDNDTESKVTCIEATKNEEHLSGKVTLPYPEEESAVQGVFEDIDKKVRVAGPGLTNGYVGVKNSFQVWSFDNAVGYPNVSITGPRPHTVTETSVLYTGDNLYEVTYEVTQPGFYKIFIKWEDISLPSSPFIAEITF